VQPSGLLGCYFCNDVVAPSDSTRDRTLDQQCTVTRPGLAPIAAATAVELLIALLHHPQVRLSVQSADRCNATSLLLFDGIPPLPTPPVCAMLRRVPCCLCVCGGRVFVCGVFSFLAQGASAEADSGASGTGEYLPGAAATRTASPLGMVPHQLRGFVAQFSTLMLKNPAFARCTACSATITAKFQEQGFEFLMKVCRWLRCLRVAGWVVMVSGFVKAFNSPTFLEEVSGLAELHATIDDAGDWWDDDGDE